MDPILFPTRQSFISLQEITTDNWKHIIRLVVNKDQLSLVTPNIESLCEHQFHLPHSIVKAIYADITPVGYIRIQREDKPSQPTNDPTTTTSTETAIPSSTYRIQCFMIDQACQGLGFGTKALVQLQDQLVAQTEAAAGFKKVSITVSTLPFATVHPDDSPEHFFAGVGFTIDDASGGKEMVWVPRS
ncbi:hypothetical protein BGX29_009430 [Mortierella sp. GBA35]|nr:hypothetical protein BGX29_009430 [Mortierella sp. GBA35]